MHLVSCGTPHEALEAAPCSSLVSERESGDVWDGFWSSQSDAYYVRRTRADGSMEWYRLTDDEAVAAVKSEPRVLALRPRTREQFVLAQSPNGRRILVGNAGTARRGAR